MSDAPSHPELLSSLSVAELLNQSQAASARGDAALSLALLQEAGRRPDANGAVFFMLASESAQQGLMEQARDQMAKAVALAPGFALARFQWGLMHLTGGDAAMALQIWAPLGELLPEGHPQAYLKRFHEGMQYLIGDQFQPAVEALRAGIAMNHENPPLNADMARIIDAIAHLPGAPLGPLPDEAAATPATEPAAEASDSDELKHLFINAYTKGGLPH